MLVKNCVRLSPALQDVPMSHDINTSREQGGRSCLSLAAQSWRHFLTDLTAIFFANAPFDYQVCESQPQSSPTYL